MTIYWAATDACYSFGRWSTRPGTEPVFALGTAGGTVESRVFPEMYPDNPYDIDKGWQARGYAWALEGKRGGAVRE